MDAQDFGHLLRYANCLSHNDFKEIFGDSYEHYMDKLAYHYKGDLAKFIMYLDMGNLDSYFAHIKMKMERE